MTFADSVVYCLRNYGKFRGRAGRAEFWWFALAFVMAVFLPAIVQVILIDLDLWRAARILDYFHVIVILGGIVPFYAVASRRLHDTNRSAWWILIKFIPFIGGIILVVWLASRGSEGANEYGPQVTTAEIRPREA